jgi:hypothetical protein
MHAQRPHAGRRHVVDLPADDVSRICRRVNTIGRTVMVGPRPGNSTLIVSRAHRAVRTCEVTTMSATGWQYLVCK